jgi:hypothetical protein
MATEQRLYVGANAATHGLEMRDRLAAPYDREVLASMLDRVE